MIRQAEFGESDVLPFGPISEIDIEDGHREFVHEKLAELENRLELHELREKRMLSAMKSMLEVIDDLKARLQQGREAV